MKHLIKAIRACGYIPISYSGRGMFGDTCAGFVCSDPKNAIIDLMDHDSTISRMLRQSQQDNMGLDYIVYFPNVAWKDEYGT